MYCIECGVKLGEAEKKCPLCNTDVYHPNYVDRPGKSLYPSEKMPKKASRSKALNGAMIILFLIPLFVCFVADLQLDGRLEWSGYVAGALMLSYIAFALPMWFQKPNPVIFVPCNFVATALYLLYINIATGGTWFLSFALPITGGLCFITCTVVTLLYYLHKGRLYIVGGAIMAFGALMLLMEFLMGVTFQLPFIGWSIYPLCVLLLFGGLLIYLAINSSAREVIERKLFF